MGTIALGVEGTAARRLWLALALAMIAGDCRRSPAPAPPNQNVRGPETAVVAVVDGQSIPLPLFNLIYESKRSSLPTNLTADRAAIDLKVTIARQLVDEYLIERAATRQGVSVTDKQVEAAVAELAKTFPNAAAFQRYVATYPQQTAGVRRTARLRLLRDGLIGTAARSPISDPEVRAYFDGHRSLYQSPAHLQLLEIAILRPSNATAKDAEQLRAKTEQILRLARVPNAAFPALAQRFSEAPSRTAGGAMAPVTAESVDAQTWQTVSRLSPGQVSPVVESKSGFHIFKLVGRQPATSVSFEQARPGIVRAIDVQRRSARVTELMRSLRKGATIDYPLERRYSAALADGAANSELKGLSPREPLPDVIREGPAPASGGKP